MLLFQSKVCKGLTSRGPCCTSDLRDSVGPFGLESLPCRETAKGLHVTQRASRARDFMAKHPLALHPCSMDWGCCNLPQQCLSLRERDKQTQSVLIEEMAAHHGVQGAPSRPAAAFRLRNHGVHWGLLQQREQNCTSQSKSCRQ